MSDEPTPIRGHRSGVGWHLEPRRRHFLLVGGILGAALLIGPGVAAAFQGKWLAAVVCILIGLAILTLPFSRTRRRLPARPWTDGTSRGVLLPTHPVKLMTIVAMGVLGSVLAAVGVLIAVQGVRDGTYGQLLGAGISLLIGALILLGAFGGVRSRRALDRGIVLTPDSVLLRTGRVATTLPWVALVAVHAHWTRHVRGLASVDEQIDNWLTLEPGPGVVESPDVLAVMSGTKDPSVPVEALAVDPYVVLALLRFYLEQPDRRPELGTDAALARVAEIERSLALSTA